MRKEMKKNIISFVTIIIGLVSIMIPFSSCNNSLIYKPDREWHFAIKSSNNSEIDTVTLKTYDETWKLTQKKIEYIYNRKKNSTGGYTQTTEMTGVIDRQGNFFTRIFLSSEIWMHPPRTGYLRVTELLPFPWIKFPIKIGQTNNWELTPKEGWEDFEGKKIIGKIHVTEKILFENPAIKDSCWVLEGIGKSEIGEFKCKYYFSEKYGFVYFFYDMNKYQIELIPTFIKL